MLASNIKAVNYSCWEWQLWGGPHRHYVIVPALQCNQQEIDKGKILKNASIHEPRPSELTFVTLELILWWCNADIGDMWQHDTWVWHSVSATGLTGQIPNTEQYLRHRKYFRWKYLVIVEPIHLEPSWKTEASYCIDALLLNFSVEAILV